MGADRERTKPTREAPPQQQSDELAKRPIGDEEVRDPRGEPDKPEQS